MKLRFKCPSCLRKVHAVEASTVGTEIVDRKCPKCKMKWRFKITVVSHSPGVMTMHSVENTARLET